MDGSTLVTVSDDTTARVWSAGDWSCLHTLRGHTDAVRGCAWAPDGSALVTTSYDGTTQVWSAAGDWSWRWTTDDVTARVRVWSDL